MTRTRWEGHTSQIMSHMDSHPCFSPSRHPQALYYLHYPHLSLSLSLFCSSPLLRIDQMPQRDGRSKEVGRRIPLQPLVWAAFWPETRMSDHCWHSDFGWLKIVYINRGVLSKNICPRNCILLGAAIPPLLPNFLFCMMLLICLEA